MSFSEEELAQIAGFGEGKVKAAVDLVKSEEPAIKAVDALASRIATVGTPDVSPDSGPTYYVHLANGDVVESKDSSSTHLDVNGTSVAVIGRYQKGE